MTIDHNPAECFECEAVLTPADAQLCSACHAYYCDDHAEAHECVCTECGLYTDACECDSEEGGDSE